MTAISLLTLIAHAADAAHAEDRGGEVAMSIILVTSLVAPLIILAIIGRIFYKAHRRDNPRAD